jgi:glycosyltransferase involved in cell wall biosynthesis
LPIVLSMLRINTYHATNNKGLPWFYFGRRILTIHDVIPLIFSDVIPGKLQRFRFVYTLKIDAKLADIIIADSVSSKKDIIKRLTVLPEKIKVIWPIIFKYYKTTVVKLRSDNAIKTGKLINGDYLIHNGGLDPRKNIPRLIDAYAQFIKTQKFSHYKLIITGRSNTPYANKIVALVESLGLKEKVIFTGAINEQQLIKLISKAKICIYPSLYEGFGLPIIEAMSAGIPVITSNVSSMPEISGGAAFLIDPMNVNDITMAMITICSDDKMQKKMIESGYKWMEENKNYNMVELTKQTYRAL